MKTLTLEDMRQLSTMTRAERQAHSCRESQLDSLNLDGLDLSGLDFSWSDFRHVSFVGACSRKQCQSRRGFTHSGRRRFGDYRFKNLISYGKNEVYRG